MATVIHKSSGTERRTRKKLLGTRVQILEEERAVTLETETTVATGTAAPTPVDVTPGGSVVSSESDYDPVTGMTTLTTVRRTATGSWTVVASYYTDADTPNNQA